MTKTRVIKFPNISRDARTLGVSRVALFKVLTGDPTFKSLKTLRIRYAELFKSKPKPERDFTAISITDPVLKELINV